jgi:serine/threonine-protein kinase
LTTKAIPRDRGVLVGDPRHGPAIVSTELVGQRIMDRYVIAEKIARGGMSVVYRGEDERLRRAVCVKVFCGLDPSRPGYRTVHEHFVQEAFALSALRHPNTISIFDFGYLEDELATPFFVVEHADGGTLKEFIRKHGPLSLHEVFEIVEPIAGALREAHGAGIIHRDIKPSNILFTHAGPSLVVKLADFSIAKALEEAFPNRADDTLNSADKVGLYSLGWAAPEQLRGDPVDPSADVFALALTVAFMLTCKAVYPGDDILKLFDLRRLGDDYIRRTLAGYGLDDEVQRVLAHACRAEPSERLLTVEQLVEALRECLAGSWRNVTSRHDRHARPEAHPPTVAMPPPVPDTESIVTFAHDSSASRAAAAVSPASSSASVDLLPGMPPGAPPVPPQGPVLTVENLRSGDLVVGGRRVRPVEVDRELVFGAEAGVVGTRARVRITPRSLGAHLHIKGLNCFLVRDGGRASSGVDLDRDADLVMLDPGRQPLDRFVVQLGQFDGAASRFSLLGVTLAVPLRLAPWVALFDIGPGRDAVLLYRRPGATP